MTATGESGGDAGGGRWQATEIVEFLETDMGEHSTNLNRDARRRRPYNESVPWIFRRILTTIGSAGNIDELANDIANACADIFDVELCSIWRIQVDEDGCRILRLAGASSGMKRPGTIAQEAKYGLGSAKDGSDADGLTGFIAQTSRPILVNSFDELMERYGQVRRGKIDSIQYGGKPQHGFRNLCGVPVKSRGELVGVLKIENHRPGSLNRVELRRLKAVARTIAGAVRCLTLVDQREQRLIAAVTDFSKMLLEPFETHELIQHIVENTAQILDVEMCSLWLVEPDRRRLRLVAQTGFLGQIEGPLVYALNWDARDDSEIDGITAWIALKKSEFWANSHKELSEHPAWKGKSRRSQWDDHQKESFRCMYGLPLEAMGQVRGVLKIENKKNAPNFSPSDRAVCRLMASYVVLALELSHRVRTEFLADVSHVVRSPLAQAVTNLDALAEELEKDVPDHQVCSTYLDLLRRMLLVVSGHAKSLAVLTQRSETALRREETEISELVERQIAAISQLAGRVRDFRRGGWREVRVPLSPREQTLAEMSVFNVLHNAVKFSDADSPIEVNMEEEPGGSLCISIQDHGQGIESADLERVFESGFRRRAAGWPEGTGMGLTTVANALAILGWEKRIQSTPNKGTRFSIIIPAERIKHGD